MPCFHPIKAYSSRTETTKRGKKVVKFNVPPSERSDYDLIEFPCRQCIGCRLDYSKQWRTRLMLERKSYQFNYFITLTYDDLHVPVNQIINTDTGEYSERLTLRKKDFQDFMKRLRIRFQREHLSSRIRFFACGEYGAHTLRPHYHAILFNCPIPDLKFLKSDNGNAYYTSDLISEIWLNQGNIIIGDVTWQSAAYVARYIISKQLGKGKELYNQSGMAEPFLLMSRNPGIGYEYFEKNKYKIYEHDYVNMLVRNRKVINLKPPKYFDEYFEKYDPFKMEEIKADRLRNAQVSRKLVQRHTSLSRDEYNELKEFIQKEKADMLKRTL